MLPPSPLTVPDVRISRIRFFAGEFCSRSVPMNDLGAGQWVACEERAEAVPWEPLGAGASCQPFPPRPCDLLCVPLQLLDVPGDAVVGIVPSHLGGQLGMLGEYRPVAVCPTPVLDSDQRPPPTMLHDPQRASATSRRLSPEQ